MVEITQTTASFLDTDMYKFTMGQFAFPRDSTLEIKLSGNPLGVLG
jgi:hypothetical protein